METEPAIARLARGQHGLVTDRQLAAVGVSPKMIRYRVSSGQWLRVERGVLRIAAVNASWESQVLAHVLAAGDCAVASHRTAGVLWGLDGCRPGSPEITVPRGRRYRRPGIRAHQSGDLALVDPIRRSGITTTPVARTLLDLGAVLPLETVHLAIDDARRRKLTDWNQLLDTLVAHSRKGRNGVGPPRAVLDQHFGEVAVTDSGFERLVISLLTEAGLPGPELQHEVTAGDHAYRIDLAYPASMLAVELDGSVHLERPVWEADHARQNALILAGWTLLRFTWRDYLDHPTRIVVEVRRGLLASGDSPRPWRADPVSRSGTH